MPVFTDLPIQTARLVLRPLTATDADALFAICSDPEIMQYWASLPWTTRQEAVDHIAQATSHLADGSSLRLAIAPAQGGAVIGTVALFAFNEQSSRAELGYLLARAEWGRGLMQEALVAVIDYGITTLGLRRFEADIDPRNLRSARRLEHLGFTEEGYLRERWVVDGITSDTALYGLLAREWRPDTPPRRSRAP